MSFYYRTPEMQNGTGFICRNCSPINFETSGFRCPNCNKSQVYKIYTPFSVTWKCRRCKSILIVEIPKSLSINTSEIPTLYSVGVRSPFNIELHCNRCNANVKVMMRESVPWADRFLNPSQNIAQPLEVRQGQI